MPEDLESPPAMLTRRPKDPSHRNCSSALSVHLYCYNKTSANGPEPIASGNVFLSVPAPLFCLFL
jgi:hypothetical protein